MQEKYMTNIIAPISNDPILDEHIFNKLGEHFHQKIYASAKGQLRLAVICADLDILLSKYPQDTTLNILDIGAGEGQVSLYLAKKGHRLTLLEPALLMQARSKELFENLSIDNSRDKSVDKSMGKSVDNHAIKIQTPQFILGELNNLNLFQDNCFDLILCHAVLEWLPEPLNKNRNLEYIVRINKLLKKNGTFSLAFYNRSGLILHNLIRGNLNAANIALENQAQDGSITNDKIKKSKSLTPLNPIDPDNMEQELHCANFKISSESGVRVFHDFMAKNTKERLPFAQILKFELAYRQHPNFKRIARYLHWMCVKLD
ncbi:S-adenosylmethionine-dependent methyltransferase [Gammaproteobacteria bacterium]|nr:S-adenosylmethionine-dependent methyltransferase [Gammaproteobacteria bacterium]